MSTIVGNVVIAAGNRDKFYKQNPEIIAESMAIIAGAIVFFLGIIRWGWLTEFISLTAVTAFITGSAFYIAMGQIPGLLGIGTKYVNNRDAPYLVVIGTLKNLRHTTLDAAIGLTGLLLLYMIKYGFAYLAKKHPSKAKLYFFCNTLRTIFVILLYTLIGWLVNRNHKGSPSFGILGEVPRGKSLRPCQSD